MEIKDFCSGMQHIGIPTNNIEKTEAFFHDLGFITAYSTVKVGEKVSFLRLNDLTIETWESGQATMRYGAIDHIAIDVKDIEAVYKLVKAKGYKTIEGRICSLPCWSNGVRFFTIEGPDKEKIEFSEYL